MNNVLELILPEHYSSESVSDWSHAILRFGVFSFFDPPDLCLTLISILFSSVLHHEP